MRKYFWLCCKNQFKVPIFWLMMAVFVLVPFFTVLAKNGPHISLLIFIPICLFWMLAAPIYATVAKRFNLPI